MEKTEKKVIAYYFPNWHVDPRNEKWHGSGWTEWRLLECARPRFPGHQQPKKPLWGYEDEADPKVMAKKIATASRYGLDGFVFDWYWFNDGPYRNRCLENGFLAAPNTEKLKFAVMWCNHDAIQAHPGSRMFPTPVLQPGSITAETFVNATQHCIDKYFPQPNYLRLGDGLYFSIYQLPKMINELGGTQKMRALFDDFRHRVEKAGLGKLHLNAVNLETMNAPESTPPAQIDALTDTLGIDSRSGHAWTWQEPDFPTRDYELVAHSNMQHYEHFSTAFKLPYHPAVCVGWDPSPRTVQSEVYENIGYPFTTILANNTPEVFEKILRQAKRFLNSRKSTAEILFLHSWNEWTEGTYLEPDKISRFDYLKVVQKVFNRKTPSKVESSEQRLFS